VIASQPLVCKRAREEEGTSGAVKCVSFRERTQETALQGTFRFGGAYRVSRFSSERPITARSQVMVFSRSSLASSHDRRCPSPTGRGKFVEASGRVDEGCKLSSIRTAVTPVLIKLGWWSSQEWPLPIGR
jgi:hypothetical protein